MNHYDDAIESLARVKLALTNEIDMVSHTLFSLIPNLPEPSRTECARVSEAKRDGLNFALKAVEKEILAVIAQRNAAGFGPAKVG